MMSWKAQLLLMLPGRHITLQDLLEQVIEGLVGVGDEQGALARAVVVQHMHDLHCSVSLPCSWGTHHHCQPRLHAGLDCLHLYAEATGVKILTASTCMQTHQLFSTPKRLFAFRNVVPTLENKTQKRLGTVKTRFYIVKML